jgi:hypothetical protein
VEPGPRSHRELSRSDEPDRHTVCVPVERTCQQHSAEDEDREQSVAAEHPADQAEHRAGAEQQGPRLEDVANDEQPAAQVASAPA